MDGGLGKLVAGRPDALLPLRARWTQMPVGPAHRYGWATRRRALPSLAFSRPGVLCILLSRWLVRGRRTNRYRAPRGYRQYLADVTSRHALTVHCCQSPPCSSTTIVGGSRAIRTLTN